MIELASALTLPLAKLLLKSWLGDTGADISVGLFDLGLKRLGDRARPGQRNTAPRRSPTP